MEPGTTTGSCPHNGQRGKRVERQTLQSLLLVDLRLVTEEAYWFCAAPACPVAYFNDSGTVIFTADHVGVPIWQKQQENSLSPICYCFKITNGMLRAEVEQTGRSSVIDEIETGIQAGLCACPLTNPQGACCLGNVRRAVKAATSPWPPCGVPAMILTTGAPWTERLICYSRPMICHSRSDFGDGCANPRCRGTRSRGRLQ